MAARIKTFETVETRENLAVAPAPTHPELDAGTRQLLAEFRPVVEQRIDDVIAEFLQYVSAWPEMRLLTQSAEGIACLRREQGRHLLNLFSCQFDAGYFARVSRMGQAHEKAGLEPRWYLGAYGHVLKILVELAIEHCGDDAARLLATVSAINRVVEIDMASAVATIDESAQPENKAAVPMIAVEGVPGLAKAALTGKQK
ncbi:MAG: hypothetical protein HOF33_13985 [Rhodospirillaceae bacterium]|jgi:hypothetical protein|nr:hypothetical protein [Rhodospirillaceae bacterium]MBT5781165.1 hypothetical protein [Rhodospirillaceae bacterium]